MAARVGDIVYYRMAHVDCATWQAEASEDPHVNVPYEGDIRPALVLANRPGGAANLRIFLDGRYESWLTDRVEGTELGMWAVRSDEMPPAPVEPEIPVEPETPTEPEIPTDPEPDAPVEPSSTPSAQEN